MANIRALQPQELWNCFADICSIPHISKHEEKLALYIIEKARSLGLQSLQDSAGNIIVRKPGSRTGIPSIALQAHIDMVPQKNEGTAHDFLADPIMPSENEGWVTAAGTTLGADNGIGAAAMLALMESGSKYPHGPLEMLFTVDEEAGMGGAFGLQPGTLQSGFLVNLDSEDSSEIIIGCAGGIDITITEKPCLKPSSIGEPLLYNITLKGFKGGHSGLDIHLGRGNAVTMLAAAAKDAISKLGADLVSFSGGSVRNAIPREASAVLALSPAKAGKLEPIAQQWQNKLKESFADENPVIEVQETIYSNQLMASRNDALDFLGSIASCPNGVHSFEKTEGQAPRTSSNLSIASLGTGGVQICILARSSSEEEKAAASQKIKEHFEKHSYASTLGGQYPGWQPAPGSMLLEEFKRSYTQISGKSPRIAVIHAGLECGIIGAKYPDMQMLSFGPTIQFPHSPSERASVSSAAVFWDILTHFLSSCKL
jgi:dipeptidase D